MEKKILTWMRLIATNHLTSLIYLYLLDISFSCQVSFGTTSDCLLTCQPLEGAKEH